MTPNDLTANPLADPLSVHLLEPVGCEPLNSARYVVRMPGVDARVVEYRPTRRSVESCTAMFDLQPPILRSVAHALCAGRFARVQFGGTLVRSNVTTRARIVHWASSGALDSEARCEPAQNGDP